MSPLTFEDAYNATNPADSEEVRKNSANMLLLGARANEVYWNSRPELEALKAQAEGHGVIVRGADDEEGEPTAVGTGTAPAIDSTATEEPTTGIGPGEGATAEGTPPAESDAERLRAQLRNAGITPEV